jgi:hypothetical protein
MTKKEKKIGTGRYEIEFYMFRMLSLGSSGFR